MKVLVGLGNPGNEHRMNRHNLGFWAVDAWVDANREQFQFKIEFEADICRFRFQDEDVIAMKPQTFYNRIGESVARVCGFYKINIEDVIAVYDEIDLPAGVIRIKKGGGSAGNNGIRSMIKHGDNFVRIRLGIGRPPHPKMEVASYVLGNLNADEQKTWTDQSARLGEAIDLCVLGRELEAMQEFNRKNGT